MQCWFCSLRDRDTEHTYAFDMYGRVAAKNGESQTDISYNVQHIQIPRCQDCHSRHKTAFFAVIGGVFFCAALTVSAVLLITEIFAPLLGGILCGLSAGLAAAAFLSAFFVQKGIVTIRKSRSTYPAVKELLSQCYRFGTRPKSALPESDPPCENDENSRRR